MRQRAPGHAESLESLAMIALRSGQGEVALRYFAELVEAHPSTPRYVDRLATLLERLGRGEEAIAAYRRLLQRHPELNNSRYNLARLVSRSGNAEAALALYGECLERGIEGPEEVHNNMGVLLGTLERHGAAREAFDRAISVQPAYLPALFNLGLLEEEHGNWDRARALFERILVVEPEHAGALARLAHGHRVMAPGDPLVDRLRQAVQAPDLADAAREELLYALGKVHDDSASYPRAFEFYARANALSSQRAGRYDRDMQEERTARVIAGCGADWLAAIEPVSDEPHVFICGMFRSGSTLAEQVLAAHPAVTAGGELDFFQRAFKSWPDSLLQAGPQQLHRLGRDYEAQLVARFPGAGRISNKRPDNALFLGLIGALFPAARIIDTRREPLDSCLSLFFQPLESAQSYANDLLDAGHYYVQHRRLMAHWHQVLPGRVHELVYEDLVADPEPEIRALLAFLGLPWDPACLDFHQLNNRVRTASVHQVRQALYGRSSGRWRHYADAVAPLRAYLNAQGLSGD